MMLAEGYSRGITTAVRIRPFSNKERFLMNNTQAVQCPESGKVKCTKRDFPPIEFCVNHTFNSQNDESIDEINASQKEVYETLALPLLDKALAGYNTCLFAYGITSSGKTHSMHGSSEYPGIIPRIVADLLSRTKSEDRSGIYEIRFSYFEIYKERIYDLLIDNHDQKSLVIHEDPIKGLYVQNLTVPTVTSPEEVYEWLRKGDARRKCAETEMNSQSSRSHSIVTFYISKREYTDSSMGASIENVLNSKFNLVDLAGCERQSWTNSTAERLAEACQINKSLFTLGLVISQLSGVRNHTPCPKSCSRSRRIRATSEGRVLTSKRKTLSNLRRRRQTFAHVSYRDSILTRILKDSLGGNSVTTMLATISPSSVRIDDTISTLQYAVRAKSIINRAVVNEDPKGRVIRELRAEIADLKRFIREAMMPQSPFFSQIRRLQAALYSHERTIDELKHELTRRISDCARFHSNIDFRPPNLELDRLNESDLNETPIRYRIQGVDDDFTYESSLITRRVKTDSGVDTGDFLEQIESRDELESTTEALKYFDFEEDDQVQSDPDDLHEYREDEPVSLEQEKIYRSGCVTRNGAPCDVEDDAIYLQKSGFSGMIEEIKELRMKLYMAEKRENLLKSRLDVKKLEVATSTNALGYRLVSEDEYSRLLKEHDEMKHQLKNLDSRNFFNDSFLFSDVAPTLDNLSEENRTEFEGAVDKYDYLENDLKSSSSTSVIFPHVSDALEMKFLERQQLFLEKLDLPLLDCRSHRHEEILSDDEFEDVLSSIDELKKKLTRLEEEEAETAQISPRSDGKSVQRPLATSILKMFAFGSVAYWFFKYCRS